MANFVGTSGNDTFSGGNPADTATGLAGNDTLSGNNGNDTILGGTGNDSLSGGSGTDSLRGGDGNDTISGGTGNDIIYGDTEASGTWNVKVYDRDFSSANDQAFTIESGILRTNTTTTNLDVTSIVNTARGTSGDPEDFGVIVTSTFVAGAAGVYRFATSSDDGSTIRLLDGNGNPLTFANQVGGNLPYMNNDFHQGPTTRFGDVTLVAGQSYTIEIRMWENLGGQVLDATVTPPGGSSTPLVSSPFITGVQGTGNDSILGGDGNDTIFGDGGNDTIDGGLNEDSIDGGTGNDSILGGDGNDTLLGGDGLDTLRGGTGTDNLTGGAGDDSLFGDTGNDTITGNDGNDTIDGGDNDDLITGGIGDDSLIGGFGNDTIGADGGNDTLSGGDGNDVLEGHDNADTITGGAGADYIVGFDVLNITLVANRTLDPTVGSDDGAADSLSGDAGNDTILGGGGNDTLDGGADNDTLIGGVGDDVLLGGAGVDSMTGGDGSDTFTVGINDYTTFVTDVVDGNESTGDNDRLDLRSFGKARTNVIFAPGNPENGTVEFLDTLGAVIGTMTFTNIEKVIPCFTPGSLVQTLHGDLPVETLVAGDCVWTRDNGFQPVRWVGRRDLSANELAAQTSLHPVLIGAGALGDNLPTQDMMVSPQHRMLFTGPRAEMMFGETEVLVAAVHLVGQPDIRRVHPASVSYIHIMFDRHEIIRADGSWTESYQAGAMSLLSMSHSQRAELFALFPELAVEGATYRSARPSLKAHEVKVLLAA